MNRSCKLKYIGVEALVFGLFLVVSYFACINHEPWSDEAQSWLIARDNSFLGIILANKYEGTPPLWQFVIKAFIFCGLKYNYFFIISYLFTAAGVFVLLFCTNVSLIFKILITFSYFTVYQSAAVSRSYSMVLLFIMLIVVFYKDRYEKPTRFFIALLLFASISSYSIVISGSFMLYELFFMVSINRHSKEKNISKKFVVWFFIAGIFLFVFMIMMIPKSDVSSPIGHSYNIYGLFDIITSTFVFSFKNKIITVIVAILLTAFYVFYMRKNVFILVTYTLPLIVYMFVLYSKPWHYLNLFYLVMATIILFKPKEKNEKTVDGVIIALLLCTQLYCSYVSINYDYKKNYTGAKDAAKFVQQYVDDGYNVVSDDYYGTGVQPYFNKNIYSNHKNNYSYYFWSFNNGYNEENVKALNPDVIVSGSNCDNYYKGYKEYKFDGCMCFKTILYEYTNYSVYVKE